MTASAARHIGTTGQYVVSRFPGYPIVELADAAVWRGGPWALNGLGALMAVLCAVMLALILRRAGVRDATLGALAFAFVPAVYIASTTPMDYLWALAFVLAALLAALDGRPLAAGVLLGVATGCRITSAAYAIPVAMVLLAPPGVRRVRALIALLVPAVIVAAVAYLPVALRYGVSFLSYYETGAGGHARSAWDFLTGMLHLFPLRFSPLLVLGQATVGVWGAVGSLALLVAIVLGFAFSHRRWRGPLASTPPALIPACWVAIALCVLFYLRLPDDEGYLIPAAAFAFVPLGRLIPRSIFRPLCVAIAFSPFVLGVDVAPPKKGITPLERSAQARTFRIGGRETFVMDPRRGPLLMDQDKRHAQMTTIAGAAARWPALPRNGVVVAGLLDLPLHREIATAPLETFDVLRPEHLAGFIHEGRPVFYLPDAPERTLRYFGYALDSAGARPLLPAPAR
jgi:hypothetical protein